MIWSVFGLLTPLNSFAQVDLHPDFAPEESAYGCGSQIVHEHLLENNTAYAARYEMSTQQIAEITLQETQGVKDNALIGVKTIPVVVHLVHYEGESIGQGSNLSDQRVQDAITYLNQGFRNIGYYDPSSGTDLELEFCLAITDPNGQLTDGITRTASDTYADFDMAPVADGGEEPAMKDNTQRWDPYSYINIWVVDEICYSLAPTGADPCGVSGFSYKADAHGMNWDGVVVEDDDFGAGFEQAKVLIHEMGHYFNLHHTFYRGCTNNNCLLDGDFICDTPPEASTSYAACPSGFNSCSTDEDDTTPVNPFRAVSLGGMGDQVDMLENYMDYSNPACQNLFTEGQKDRMRISLSILRNSLLESVGCNSPFNFDVGITGVVNPTTFNCDNMVTPQVELTNFGNIPTTSVTIHYLLDNGIANTYNWEGYVATGDKQVIELPQIATPLNFELHTLNISTSNPNGNADQNTGNDTYTSTFDYIDITDLPYFNDFESPNLGNEAIIQNLDENITWQLVDNVNSCDEGGENGSSQALFVPNYNYTTGIGQKDYLFFRVNIANFDLINLEFDVAYAPYNLGFSDRLKVIVSDNCGASFTSVYNESGMELSTHPATTTFWQPNSCNDWRSESMSLLDFVGASELLIGFVCDSGYGNNLYLDNIRMTGEENFFCDAPMLESITNVSYMGAEISWGEAPLALTYTIRYRELGTTAWTVLPNMSSPAALTNLQSERTYEVQVRSACAENSSPYSGIGIFTTQNPGDCAPISSINVESVTQNGAYIVWNDVLQATAYLVSCKPNVDSITEWVDKIEAENFTILDNLEENQEYILKVRSSCNSSLSPETQQTVTFTPYLNCNVPIGLVVENVTNTTAVLTWLGSDIAIGGYTVEYCNQNTGACNSMTAVQNQTEMVLTNLEAGVVYTCRLKAACGFAVSNFTSSLSFETMPTCAPPIVANPTDITDNTAKLTWGAPIATANAYVLKWRTIGENIWNEQSISGETTWELENLLPCIGYEFRLQSQCEFESSTFGETHTFFTTCDDYCLAYGENATKEWITGLKMSGVNHTSGNDNGFGNHTDQNIVVTPGLIYDINLTGQIDKKSANEYWTVWIDTNLNRIFEPEEIVFSESYGSIGSLETDVIVASGKVWVDYDFPIATTRLRVALSYKNPMETCDIITYGEVEDYTCTIQYLKTGLNQMEQDDLLRFDIAPNPAKNKVNIHYFHPQQEEVQVKLFAPNGRLLQQHRLTEQPNYAHTFELDMGGLPSGLYLVQLQTGGAIQTRKLMIME